MSFQSWRMRAPDTSSPAFLPSSTAASNAPVRRSSSSSSSRVSASARRHGSSATVCTSSSTSMLRIDPSAARHRSSAGNAVLRKAPGTGLPCSGIAASTQASPSARRSAAATPGQSTGRKTTTSFAASASAAIMPAAGCLTDDPSSRIENGSPSSSAAFPTASRSSHASPSVRHPRSASVSPRNPASAFEEPKRRLAPPTSRTPVRRCATSASRRSCGRLERTRRASFPGLRRARPRDSTGRRLRRGSGSRRLRPSEQARTRAVR